MHVISILAEGAGSCCQPMLLYIDPATTSYLIQIGAGVIIALGTFIGIYRNKIKRFFRKNKDEAIPQAEKGGNAKKEVVTADDLMENED